METGVSVNKRRLGLQPAAAFHLDLFQRIKRSERAICERLIREWPQAFGRLQLWRIGWEKHEMDPLGNSELGAGVPPSPVQEQHHAFVWPNTHFLGKEGQGLREDLYIHGGQ